MHLGSGATGTLGADEGRAAPFWGSLGTALFFGEDGDGWKPSFLGGRRCGIGAFLFGVGARVGQAWYGWGLR
jgi:hypothetical protein